MGTIWGILIWAVVASPASAFGYSRCAQLLGNPYLRQDYERVNGMSNGELLTVRIGTLQKGDNPFLNDALDLAKAYGVRVVVHHTEAIHRDPFFQRAADRVNMAGSFSTDNEGEPQLAFGSGLDPEFAVHEITHLKDYVAKVKRFEAQGMSRADAKHAARMNEQSLPEHRAWERVAVINQLKYRYRHTGFELWDNNLIERLCYPEVAVLVTRGLILRGNDDGLDSREVMDRAIWKALVIQRLRYRFLMVKAAKLRADLQTTTAELAERQARELRRATVLFDQMFPATDLGKGQLQLVRGLFVTQFRGQNARLAQLKDNSFSIDSE